MHITAGVKVSNKTSLAMVVYREIAKPAEHW